MLRLPDLDVLRAAKRNKRSDYDVLPSHGDDDYVSDDDDNRRLGKHDPEKGPMSPQFSTFPSHQRSDQSSEYSGSSRHTSGSHQPMLASLPPPTSRRRAAPPRCYKLPSRIVRYLCIALIGTVVLVIVSLIRMSYVSARRIESGELRRPTPPPHWNDFPFLRRYYGGIRSLISRTSNVPEYPREGVEEASPSDAQRPDLEIFPSALNFDPYPDYASDGYTAQYGPVMDCVSGTNLSAIVPGLRAYAGVPRGFPDAIMGSAAVLGLRDDICFDKFGRFGPYGYGYSVKSGGTGAGLHGDREGIEKVWNEKPPIDYTSIDWGELQDRCQSLNKERFSTDSRQLNPVQPFQSTEDAKSSLTNVRSPAPNLLPKTAFIIRTWWTFEYLEEHVLFLRSLITELSLLSSGEYTVHILVHVQDDNAQIWASPAVYEDVLHRSLPEEFWGLASLWSERQMGLIYGGVHESFFRDLPVHGAYRSTFMPIQWFAQQHPEYEHFWHWEMDARYTGHIYHLLDRLGSWSREQPRKGLWERNSRFYVPSVHGSWDDFQQMVRVQTEYGTESPNNMWSGLRGSSGDPSKPSSSSKNRGEKPIWGPKRPLEESDVLQTEYDTTPPTSYASDRYVWGVGEEADLITLNPMFDPEGTEWVLSDDVTGYNTTLGLPPRRSATITTSRLSRRLLQTMHDETVLKRHTMFSEMWPATCALHHGLKAVYAPHPVYIDREWPTGYLAAVFNGGKNGATGGGRTSVFGERQHNFLGTSWFYNAGFGPNLWRRWLGFRIDGGGGEEEEEMAMSGEGEGRMCLPGMLVHPVKDVRLPVEGNVGNADEGRGDQSDEDE